MPRGVSLLCLAISKYATCVSCFLFNMSLSSLVLVEVSLEPTFLFISTPGSFTSSCVTTWPVSKLILESYS